MSQGNFEPIEWRNSPLADKDGAHDQHLSTRPKKRRLENPNRKESKCLCKGLPIGATLLSGELSIINCPKCQGPYHDKCVGLYIGVTTGYDVAGEAPSWFLCPRCRLEDLDPFHPVMKILHLVSLFDDPYDQESQRSLPLQSPNIQELRRKGCEVFVMCLRLDGGNNALIHEWPYLLTATINKNVEKVKKPEYEHKRRDVPMKITPFLYGNTSNEIRIQAEKAPDAGQEQWAVSLVLCNSESVESLEASILAKNRLPYDVARALTMNNIDKFFGRKPSASSIEGGESLSDEDDDDEVDIVDTSCKVRLLDPITLARLNIPVRGRNCKHLECFDLNSFLTVTKTAKSYANRWKCVVCNQFTRPKDLVIDSFIESLLHQTSAEAEAVVFDASGNWEELKVKWTVNDADTLDDDASEDGKTSQNIPNVVSLNVPPTIDIIDDEEDDENSAINVSQIVDNLRKVETDVVPSVQSAPPAYIVPPEHISRSAAEVSPLTSSSASPSPLQPLQAPMVYQAADIPLSVHQQQFLTGVLQPGHLSPPEVYNNAGYGVSPIGMSSEYTNAPAYVAYDMYNQVNQTQAPSNIYPPPYYDARAPISHEWPAARPPLSNQPPSVAQSVRFEYKPNSPHPRHVNMTFGNWQGPGLPQGAPPR